MIDGIDPGILAELAPRPGRRPLVPELGPEAQLALMCRMLFREGWDDHIAGHITIRLDDGRILSNPWELAWDEVCAGDIITLDAEGKVVAGDWNVTPAIGLHLELHERRPDVVVIVHNHPRYAGIWAALGEVPPVHDQSSGYVDGDLPLYSEYDGTFDGADTTRAAVDALGDAKWALLANHGALVVAANVRQAHLRAITLEWRSRRAWEVRLAGGADGLSEEAVAGIALPDQFGFPFLWEAMARREIRRDPSVLE